MRGGGGRRTGRSTDVHRRREGEERGGEAEDEGGESGTVPAGIPRDEEATPPVLSRDSQHEQAIIRMNKVREAASELGLQLRENLMGATREDLCMRERWGREPIKGGGWLVLFAHGQLGEGENMWDGCVVEVRLAVLHAQWGWGAFAVSKCKGGVTVGWYEGDQLVGGAREWDTVGSGGGKVGNIHYKRAILMMRHL